MWKGGGNLTEWAAKEGLENHLIMDLEWPLTLL